MKSNGLNIIDRVAAPTPKFFKKLRNIGLVLAATGGVIMTSPISLPALIITIGGYLTVAGSVMTAVSQVTVDEEKLKSEYH